LHNTIKDSTHTHALSGTLDKMASGNKDNSEKVAEFLAWFNEHEMKADLRQTWARMTEEQKKTLVTKAAMIEPDVVSPKCFFAFHHREQVAAANPGISDQDLNQLLSQMWEDLEASKKQFFAKLIADRLNI